MPWDDRKLDRDDDPYHAWSYEWRINNLGEAQDGYCPVIVEFVAEVETNEEMIARLEAIATIVGSDGAKFLMTQSDLAHLGRVIERRKKLDHWVRPADYERLFLVYIEEKLLFPDISGELGEVFAANLAVVYVGRPVGASGPKFVKRGEPFLPGGPDACLAIIDDSFAFLNDALIDNDTNGAGARGSRFQEIWFQQEVDPKQGSAITGGLSLRKVDIDAMIGGLGTKSERQVYETPFKTFDGLTFHGIDMASTAHQPLAFSVSHGTHVTDTALRTYASHKSLDGLALFGVALPVSVTQDSSGSSLGSYLLAALRQVMLWADDTIVFDKDDNEIAAPLVINFSYGFAAGPKDGSDTLNRIIQRMVDARNDAGRETALVVPMGNSFNDRGVATKELKKDAYLDFEWVVHPQDRTPSFVEIVSSALTGDGDFCVSLTGPGGDEVPEDVQINGSRIGKARVLLEAGNMTAMISEWAAPDCDPDWKRRAVIGLAPTTATDAPTAVSGRWKVRITNTSNKKLDLYVTVQRDDAPGTYPVLGRQSYLDTQNSHATPGKYALSDTKFPPGSDLTHRWTCSVFANNKSTHVFAVGAGMGEYGADEGQDMVGPSPYASAGPRGNGRFGPTVSALADRSRAFRGIFGAGTYSGADQALSGSSVAVPQLSGLLAAKPEEIAKLAKQQDSHERPTMDLRLLRFRP